MLFFFHQLKEHLLWKLFFGRKYKSLTQISNIMVSSIDIGKWFLTINKPMSSINNFCYIWSFWKKYLATQKLIIALPYEFARLFLHFSFQCIVHFLFNIFVIIKWYIFTFLLMILSHLMYCIRLGLSFLEF